MNMLPFQFFAETTSLEILCFVFVSCLFWIRWPRWCKPEYVATAVPPFLTPFVLKCPEKAMCTLPGSTSLPVMYSLFGALVVNSF